MNLQVICTLGDDENNTGKTEKFTAGLSTWQDVKCYFLCLNLVSRLIRIQTVLTYGGCINRQLRCVGRQALLWQTIHSVLSLYQNFNLIAFNFYRKIVDTLTCQ